jgi:hypothetical protein
MDKTKQIKYLYALMEEHRNGAWTELEYGHDLPLLRKLARGCAAQRPGVRYIVALRENNQVVFRARNKTSTVRRLLLGRW